MTTGTAVATTERKSVTRDMATRYGMEPDAFEAVVRATCMPTGRDAPQATPAEFAAFLLVAKDYTLNPLLKEIYAYPRKGGGIVPVVSIDGWLSLINRRKELDGIEFDENHDDKGKLISITCRIYRNDRKHATIVTEHLSECIRDTQPWKMPHRMLRHKALIQAARYAFGFAGIHDEDEAQRIVEATAQEVISGPTPPPAEVMEQVRAAAAPAEVIEEATYTEAEIPAGAVTEVGPDGKLQAQTAEVAAEAAEEVFDAEEWLDRVHGVFAACKTPDDIDQAVEMFADTANELPRLERQKFEDMHGAAQQRVMELQATPEVAEVTGEPGPAPAEMSDAQADEAYSAQPAPTATDDEDDDSFPGDTPTVSAGEVWVGKVRALIKQGLNAAALADAFNSMSAERDQLIQAGALTLERAGELRLEVEAEWKRLKKAEKAAAPKAEKKAERPADAGIDPATVDIDSYVEEFRASVEACPNVKAVNDYADATLPLRTKLKERDPASWDVFRGLIIKRRNVLNGIA